jgi:AhpC/TSA family
VDNTVVIGQKAPEFIVSDWVQGEPSTIAQLSGRVILLEVFQVNCPGCFLYSLPEAIALHQQYHSQGLSVIGIATAFEDFDKNTLENLRLLVETGRVIGETCRMLENQNLLKEGRLPFSIPFPLAMDSLVKREGVLENEIDGFIQLHIPHFESLPDALQQINRQQISNYLEKQIYRPSTFNLYALKGTPSQILIDRKGRLREVNFGNHPDLEGRVIGLL